MTSCTQCPGSPQYACSTGAPTCTQNGWSGCSEGGSPCPLPPPNWNCGAGYTLACGASGWVCRSAANSPLVVDLANEGFHLTGWQDGVEFTFAPDLGRVRTGWTDSAFRNGFLVLDRNGNGVIDNGGELFGDVTAQPQSGQPNGFKALGVFDRRDAGGNDNGFIDPGDRVFSNLRVWIDANHDGFSQTEELKTLDEMGVLRIGLQYHKAPFVDEHGNAFRYRGNIWMDKKGKPHAAVYDVFFVSRPSQ